MLSASTEAESIKTLVGLGQPFDAGARLGFFEQTLPDSGIREFDGADHDDGFAEYEADTCVELIPPVSELLDDAGGEPLREVEPLPVNWEDEEEEATRPQLFLPDHPSEPPPSLPGTRLADSGTESWS